MKLHLYKREKPTVQAKPSLIQTISANRRGEYFSLNIKAIEVFGLTKNCYVIIAKDEDSRNDWYMTFGENLEGGTKLRFMVRNGHASSMRTRNKKAVIDLLNSVKAEKGATFIISKTPKLIAGRNWYKILTKNPEKR